MMDDISDGLPAMLHALKIQQKASRIGFDWNEAKSALPVIHGELKELTEEINLSLEKSSHDNNQSAIEDELGDVLFSCINLSRKLNIDPERALRRSNRKFIQRFNQLEEYYQSDLDAMENASLEQLEQIWQKIKN